MSWWRNYRCGKGKHVAAFWSSSYRDRPGHWVRHGSHLPPWEKDNVAYYCKHCEEPLNRVAVQEFTIKERSIISTECPKFKITTQIVEVPQ